MEREPIFNNEKIPDEQLILLLKEKGIDDLETKKLLIRWTIEQEKEVENSTDPEAPIQFNLRRARLYFEAGYTAEALENFEDARVQAFYEQRNDLYDKIVKEIKKL